MVSISSLTRRSPAKGFVSGVAMALSLAGGAVLGTAAFAPVALAQDYSKKFIETYQPLAEIVNAEGADVAAASAQFPALVAAAQTADDRNAAGNLILIAGNKANNPAWQRQGLEMMVASGKVAPEQLGQFQWFIGNLAFQAEDFAAARAALTAAQQAGWTENDPTALIAESYIRGGDPTTGVNYLMQQINARAAAGQPVAEDVLLRGLQAAYEANLAQPSIELSKVLVRNHASPRNWTNALQVVGALSEFSEAQDLDLLRLMRLTGAMSHRNEYIRYIEAADPRIMSNEVVDVLAEAVAAGEVQTSENYYTEIKSIVDARMAGDRRDAPSSVRHAEGSASGRDALTTGDLLYSLDDFAGAERMYALAVQKGGVDANVANTRLGIAQTRQGKHAEAKASFGKVTGTGAPVAAMWTAYVDTQAS